ncbi:hypothetical protein [Ectothiorhodospira lacustris]|uniref:hypothetical protein n=1 Tax=Ectothiorhodospira lacustris TaxID=2899127 RepID=UPI001EE7D809|nr:hypothetical protein [Ectothiorhodospira lacustris]MCG5510661.1 hypothetical protein [Ectothiorhodospira lacustris]MCG5522439.1 hypothetical protein [Ectothiorhodospira lacustris]
MSPTYHTLIHLGAGTQPPVAFYTALAENSWLIDADPQVIAKRQDELEDQSGLQVRQALIDTEQRPGTFHRYNLSWANGLIPPSQTVQRLYPGLVCLAKEDQLTTDIKQLIKEISPDGHRPNLLIMDLGDKAQALLDELQQSGQLSAFSRVVVIPAPRGAQPLALPPSLHGPLYNPEARLGGLPEQQQVFVRHPLAEDNRRLTQERDAKAKALEAEQGKTAQLAKERDTLKSQCEEQAQRAEQLTQENAAFKDDIAKLKQQRDEFKAQAEQHQQALKHAQQQAIELTATRDQLTQKNKELQDAKDALATEKAELQKQLEASQQKKQQQEKEVTEMQHRQHLFQEEMIKAEAQIELIKDLLLREQQESTAES